ncbi:Receptor-type guanylate cyclase gcy-22 [Parelaphostrongylus tenuis]|uniref:Receptor-type guanylate cyclase gcy-22 n=1 Tax=Parelaphostrongylus tenuis TaxID=148309 RepID=A0AAD5QW94_PARTN|nr:Receptor-type guanylate cyclase gcy-22 [Parelaphostrongylus tenuis]
MIKRGGEKLIRPQLDTEDEINSSMSMLVRDCWSEEAHQRPSCDQLKSFIKSMNTNKSSNLMDHVFNLLEQHASHLEDEINERMKELTAEKKKSDVLLYRMLPKCPAMEASRKVIRNLVLYKFQLEHNFQTAFDNINRAKGRQVVRRTAAYE